MDRYFCGVVVCILPKLEGTVIIEGFCLDVCIEIGILKTLHQPFGKARYITEQQQRGNIFDEIKFSYIIRHYQGPTILHPRSGRLC